ncbi:MAG: hypothetical protein CV080_02025 [Candidatus Kuenenia stuttgartiensis]|jgi:hypothetical protein|nr:MAG: hypothetical protein CV080_02025 [Candidatus Kuenenia stuttgartiensis]
MDTFFPGKTRNCGDIKYIKKTIYVFKNYYEMVIKIVKDCFCGNQAFPLKKGVNFAFFRQKFQ